MSLSIPAAPDPPAAAEAAQNESPAAMPFGLQVASILCWVVGAVSIFGALSLPAPVDAVTGVAFAVNLLSAGSVLTAGFAVRRRRQLAGYLVGGAWLVPNALSLALGGSLRLGGPLLILAIITVAANWRELH